MESTPEKSQNIEMIPYEKVIRSIIDTESETIDSFLHHLFPEVSPNGKILIKEFLVDIALRGVDIGLSLNCTSLEDEISIYYSGFQDGATTDN